MSKVINAIEPLYSYVDEKSVENGLIILIYDQSANQNFKISKHAIKELSD